MNRLSLGLSACALSALAAGPLFASDTTRQLDSHQHGHASLNVAVDANQVLIEFESPAANIVGFEHEPENDAQKDAIEKAEDMLKDGSTVFVMPAGAGCKLTDADVEAPYDEHHDEHHGEKHDEKHADEDKHEKHSDEEGETHSEFHATWAFTCDAIDKLDTIDVRLFEMFPGTEEVDASFISSKGQGASELSANATQISF